MHGNAILDAQCFQVPVFPRLHPIALHGEPELMPEAGAVYLPRPGTQHPCVTIQCVIWRQMPNPALPCRHALLFRDRFNMTGVIADIAPPLLDQLSATPGALSQV